jgi:hypothetical protein
VSGARQHIRFSDGKILSDSVILKTGQYTDFGWTEDQSLSSEAAIRSFSDSLGA